MVKDNVFDASSVKWPKSQHPLKPIWGNLCDGRTGELIAKIDFTNKEPFKTEETFTVKCVWNEDGTLTLSED